MARAKRGTVEGELASEKWKATMIERYGEDYREVMREIGAMGGKKSKNGGFASAKVDKNGMTGAQRAKVFGSIGGKISKRNKKKIEVEGE